MSGNQDVIITIKAFSIILNEIVEDIKIELYSNKDLNVSKYLIEKKKFYFKKRAKLVQDLDIVFEDNNSEVDSTDDENNEYSEEYLEENPDEYSEEMFDEYDYVDKELNNYDSKKGQIKDFHNQLKSSSDDINNVDDIMEYFSNLESNDKNRLIEKFKEIKNYIKNKEKSLIKVLNMNTSLSVKKVLITKINKLINGQIDKSKMTSWIENAMRIPFGIYKGIDIKKLKGSKKITKFLNNLRKDMDSAIYITIKRKNKL